MFLAMPTLCYYAAKRKVNSDSIADLSILYYQEKWTSFRYFLCMYDAFSIIYFILGYLAQN